MSKHAWASRWQLQQNSMTRCSDMWSLVSLQCRVVTAPEEKWWAAFWKCQVWHFKLACADKCLTHTEQKGCLGTLDRTFVVKMTMSWAAHVSRIYSLFNKYRYVLNTYYVPGTTSQMEEVRRRRHSLTSEEFRILRTKAESFTMWFRPTTRGIRDGEEF